MKKIFVLILLTTSSIASLAQQGSMYIGGLVGYSSNVHENATSFRTTTTNWALAPEAGTFLKDDIQLGLALGLGGSAIKDDNGKLYSSSYFNPTVYTRKFFKIEDNFSVFSGFYLNYISGGTTNYAGGTSVTGTQSGIALRLGVGVAFALSPRFTAVGQYGLLGFQSVTSKTGSTVTSKDSSLNFGVNTVGSSTLSQGNGSGAVFNIGIYYTFKKS